MALFPKSTPSVVSMPPATVLPVQRTARHGGKLFIVYLFLLVSRAHELLLPIPKIMLIIGLVALTLGIANSGVVWLLRVNLSRLLCALTVLMFISGAFGYWISGSLQVIAFHWIPALLVFLVGAPTMTNAKRVQGALYAIALASTFLGVMSVLNDASTLGRLIGVGGTVDDPNDLATLLIFGIPGWILFLLNSRLFVGRIASIAAIILNIVVALWTGSRGGLIALAVLVILIVFSASLAVKLLTAVAVFITISFTVTFLPDSVMFRYRTLFGDHNEQLAEGEPRTKDSSLRVRAAKGSMEARAVLLENSLLVTMRHPLLGVGPGNFMVADNDVADAQRVRRRWQQTHNSYTQVSSELGIPGLLIYVAILINCFRSCRKVAKAHRLAKDRCPWKRNVALCTMWCVVIFCVSSTFLSIAYTFYLPTIATLAFGLQMELLPIQRT